MFLVLVGLCFSLNIFVSDVCEEDRSDSDSGSDSLQGSDEDGFLEDDDDGNMVMIHQITTGSTQILSSCTTHVNMYCQVMGYSDSEDDDSEYDSESDDEEMAYNQGRGKSSGKTLHIVPLPICLVI